MQPFSKKIFQSFAQLKLAISLLLIIAMSSIIGTIIEQNQNPDFYLLSYPNLIANTHFTLGEILLQLGLNHVYSSLWFISLLLIFAFCLISCTIIQQVPILKKAKLITFQTNKLRSENQKNSEEINTKLRKKINRQLIKNQYNIFQQNKIHYAYKGLTGRFAPIIVHASMLLILFGTLITALTGFQGQEIIPQGEIMQTQNIVSQNFLSHLKPTTIRINDFWIEYNQQHNIQQFYSDISMLSTQGQEKLRQTIKVNFPLHYQNLTIYQTDWNISGIRIQENEKIRQIITQPLNQAKTIWISWIPNALETNENIILLLNNLEGKYQVFSENGNNLGNYTLNEIIPNSNLKIISFIPETGLQIKSDPGIPIIYFGFGILMISSLLSYLSYNQYWLFENKKQILLQGFTNRAKLNLTTQVKSFQQE